MPRKITYEEHLEDREKFQPYIDLLEDDDEHQTVVRELFNLSHIDYLGEAFVQEYYKEIRSQLKWFQKHVEIRTTKEEQKIVKIEPQKYLYYDE